MIWADMNPLSCYGTNDGTKAGAVVVAGLGLPELKKMVHKLVCLCQAPGRLRLRLRRSKKKLLAEDAVVVVLGKARRVPPPSPETTHLPSAPARETLHCGVRAG
jgi:hypothetical protein